MSGYKIRVYKIVNDIDDKIYVGSTKEKLSKRFGQHKSDYTKNKIKPRQISKKASFALFDKCGIEICHIVLIVEYMVTSREEQLKYERKHFDELKLHIVNRIRPYVTKEEIVERCNTQNINYASSHKKEKLAYDKVRRKLTENCGFCHCVISKHHRIRHFKSKKHKFNKLQFELEELNNIHAETMQRHKDLYPFNV
jgi:hypothetical protein